MAISVQFGGNYFVYIIGVSEWLGFVWTWKILFCKFDYSLTDTHVLLLQAFMKLKFSDVQYIVFNCA